VSPQAAAVPHFASASQPDPIPLHSPRPSHAFAGGYAAGYYAYLWSEMLENAAIAWFERNGGLTRANGDRLREMVLSRGNSQDLATVFDGWVEESNLEIR